MFLPFFPLFLKASRVRCTVGEITEAMERVSDENGT